MLSKQSTYEQDDDDETVEDVNLDADDREPPV